MTSTKYILGAGLVGLAAAYRLPTYKVISRPPELSTLSEGPYYLHSSPPTTDLLDSLDLPIDTRLVKYGYMRGAHVFAPEVHTIQDYHQRVYYSKASDEYVQRHLSGQHEVYCVTMAQLYRALYDEVGARIIGDEVASIDQEERILKGLTERYHYEQLISTIPAYALNSALGVQAELPGRSLYVSKVPADLFPVNIYDTEFDYIYWLTGKANRITRWLYPWVIVESYMPQHFKEEKELILGKVCSSQQPDDGITRIGRWAKWQNGYMFHDALADISKIGVI